ncbi:SUMF1/EgtB/PvdO family nonheme iron enzyme [Dethiosulfatarculus sandiegensis]|uniref:SUMF1/EgtB/PvdO family nonheme iron enzyme n=1 Tax=Dethiosulfatarculus sandiegensis TaxID=1429043 RepID=UPI000698C6A6|nr:SUMF1/EgtB/PvdO family nonheme iron enzyme [Dethiosulfatarculus sandiegensis]
MSQCSLNSFLTRRFSSRICWGLFVFVFLACSVWFQIALAQKRGIAARSGGAILEKRVALVIGNAAYDQGRLKNPVNDARDMASLLRKLGFSVILKENLGQVQMKMAIDRFGKKLKNCRVGLFYYSGHGAGVNGENYLIPVGTDIPNQELVEYQAVRASRVLAWMQAAKSGLNIMLLDACRNNPYATGFRSPEAGLSTVKRMPQGTIVAFAAAPGEAAADGRGRNSPFTGALLKYLGQPDLSAKRALEKVQLEVYERTGHRQSPWLQNSPLSGEFYFKPRPAAPVDEPVIKDDPLPEKQPEPLPAKTDDSDLKIANLLARAGELYEARALTTPLGNSAYDFYKKVLLLKPDHRLAQEGLRRIVARYAAWAEERIKAGDFAKAETFITRAEQVIKDDQRLTDLRAKLAKARENTFFGPGGKRFVNSLGMEFVLMPSGVFMMGSPAGESQRDSDEALHKVVLSHSYYMQTTEVTIGQYLIYLNETANINGIDLGSPDCPVVRQVDGLFRMKSGRGRLWGDLNQPMIHVNWLGAMGYADWLSSKEGFKYYLPTEAQWEYACRAGSRTPFSTGRNIASTQANYDAQRPMPGFAGGKFRKRTLPVKSFGPNTWGLYDMHGNVWEWCLDRYGPYPIGAVTDPAGAAVGDKRVLRGGSWISSAANLRSARRRWEDPSDRFSPNGFRLIRLTNARNL